MKRKKTLHEGKRYRSVGIILFCILCVIAFIGVFAYQWQKEFRSIRLNIDGTIITTTKEIQKLAALPDSTSLADLDLHQVSARILKHPYIKGVDLTRNPPDELEVKITERTPIAVVISQQEQEFYIDADGVVLPHVSSPYIYDLPVLTGSPADIVFVPGKRILYPKLQQAIIVLQTASGLDKNVYHLISEINISQKKDLILYTLENGIPVIFGPSIDAERKLRYFDAFWKNVVMNAGSNRLEYIDLRFAERVIARWNDDYMKPAPAVRDSVIEEL